MKDKILILVSTAIPITLFSLIYFGDCDGFSESFRTSTATVAVLMILVPAVISAISVICALILFFKTYGTRTTDGVATINRRAATAIAFGLVFFIFSTHVASSLICNR
jgi:hypothetical protein